MLDFLVEKILFFFKKSQNLENIIQEDCKTTFSWTV